MVSIINSWLCVVDHTKVINTLQKLSHLTIRASWEFLFSQQHLKLGWSWLPRLYQSLTRYASLQWCRSFLLEYHGFPISLNSGRKKKTSNLRCTEDPIVIKSGLLTHLLETYGEKCNFFSSNLLDRHERSWQSQSFNEFCWKEFLLVFLRLSELVNFSWSRKNRRASNIYDLDLPGSVE